MRLLAQAINVLEALMLFYDSAILRSSSQVILVSTILYLFLLLIFHFFHCFGLLWSSCAVNCCDRNCKLFVIPPFHSIYSAWCTFLFVPLVFFSDFNQLLSSSTPLYLVWLGVTWLDLNPHIVSYDCSSCHFFTSQYLINLTNLLTTFYFEECYT